MAGAPTLPLGSVPPPEESPSERDESPREPSSSARPAPNALEPLVDDPRVGTVIENRYRIVRRIGRGGMGVVFEGEHLLIGRRVAIKCLHPQFAADEDALRRFQNEALAVTAIGHPNIIEAIDAGRMPDGSAFLVFELLSGRDLATELEERSALPLGEALHVVLQICDALAATHAKGIVHRDLKPENVFLVSRPNDPSFVKVLDFGISKLESAHPSAMTAAGAVMGTPHYMSPEQASGRDVDASTDLYALGVLLYNALTGRLPFDADSIPALLMKICVEAPTPPRRVKPELPAGIDDVVLRLLAKRREERFESASAVSAALLKVAATAGISAAASPGLHLTAPVTVVSSAVSAHATQLTAAVGEQRGSELHRVASWGSLQTDSGDGARRDASSRSAVFRVLAVAAALLFAAAVALGTWALVVRPPDDRASSVEPAPVAAQPVLLEPVHVRIRVTPADAILVVDGRRVSAPFSAFVPPDRENHVLTASREGYAPVTRLITFDVSREIELVLREEGAASRHAPPTGRSSPAQGVRATREAEVTTEAPAGARTTPSAAASPSPDPATPDPATRVLKRVQF